MIKKVYDTIVTSLDIDTTVQNNLNTDNSKSVIAKIDTGATVSFIKQEIAKDLNLQALGLFRIKTANGYVDGIQYLINLYIDGEKFKDVPIIALPRLTTDMLIGMEFLKEGTTKITNDSGRTIFEFYLNPKRLDLF